MSAGASNVSSLSRKQAQFILGFPAEDDVTENSVQKAFKRLALVFHPDKSKDENSKSKFQQIVAARDLLVDWCRSSKSVLHRVVYEATTGRAEKKQAEQQRTASAATGAPQSARHAYSGNPNGTNPRAPWTAFSDIHPPNGSASSQMPGGAAGPASQSKFSTRPSHHPDRPRPGSAVPAGGTWSGRKEFFPEGTRFSEYSTTASSTTRGTTTWSEAPGASAASASSATGHSSSRSENLTKHKVYWECSACKVNEMAGLSYRVKKHCIEINHAHICACGYPFSSHRLTTGQDSKRTKRYTCADSGCENFEYVLPNSTDLTPCPTCGHAQACHSTVIETKEVTVEEAGGGKATYSAAGTTASSKRTSTANSSSNAATQRMKTASTGPGAPGEQDVKRPQSAAASFLKEHYGTAKKTVGAPRTAADKVVDDFEDLFAAPEDSTLRSARTRQDPETSELFQSFLKETLGEWTEPNRAAGRDPTTGGKAAVPRVWRPKTAGARLYKDQTPRTGNNKESNSPADFPGYNRWSNAERPVSAAGPRPDHRPLSAVPRPASAGRMRPASARSTRPMRARPMQQQPGASSNDAKSSSAAPKIPEESPEKSSAEPPTPTGGGENTSNPPDPTPDLDIIEDDDVTSSDASPKKSYSNTTVTKDFNFSNRKRERTPSATTSTSQQLPQTGLNSRATPWLKAAEALKMDIQRELKMRPKVMTVDQFNDFKAAREAEEGGTSTTSAGGGAPSASKEQSIPSVQSSPQRPQVPMSARQHTSPVRKNAGGSGMRSSRAYSTTEDYTSAEQISPPQRRHSFSSLRPMSAPASRGVAAQRRMSDGEVVLETAAQDSQPADGKATGLSRGGATPLDRYIDGLEIKAGAANKHSRSRLRKFASKSGGAEQKDVGRAKAVPSASNTKLQGRTTTPSGQEQEPAAEPLGKKGKEEAQPTRNNSPLLRNIDSDQDDLLDYNDESDGEVDYIFTEEAAAPVPSASPLRNAREMAEQQQIGGFASTKSSGSFAASCTTAGRGGASVNKVAARQPDDSPISILEDEQGGDQDQDPFAEEKTSAVLMADIASSFNELKEHLSKSSVSSSSKQSQERSKSKESVTYSQNDFHAPESSVGNASVVRDSEEPPQEPPESSDTDSDADVISRQRGMKKSGSRLEMSPPPFPFAHDEPFEVGGEKIKPVSLLPGNTSTFPATFTSHTASSGSIHPAGTIPATGTNTVETTANRYKQADTPLFGRSVQEPDSVELNSVDSDSDGEDVEQELLRAGEDDGRENSEDEDVKVHADEPDPVLYSEATLIAGLEEELKSETSITDQKHHQNANFPSTNLLHRGAFTTGGSTSSSSGSSTTAAAAVAGATTSSQTQTARSAAAKARPRRPASAARRNSTPRATGSSGATRDHRRRSGRPNASPTAGGAAARGTTRTGAGTSSASSTVASSGTSTATTSRNHPGRSRAARPVSSRGTRSSTGEQGGSSSSTGKAGTPRGASGASSAKLKFHSDQRVEQRKEYNTEADAKRAQQTPREQAGQWAAPKDGPTVHCGGLGPWENGLRSSSSPVPAAKAKVEEPKTEDVAVDGNDVDNGIAKKTASKEPADHAPQAGESVKPPLTLPLPKEDKGPPSGHVFVMDDSPPVYSETASYKTVKSATTTAPPAPPPRPTSAMSGSMTARQINPPRAKPFYHLFGVGSNTARPQSARPGGSSTNDDDDGDFITVPWWQRMHGKQTQQRAAAQAANAEKIKIMKAWQKEKKQLLAETETALVFTDPFAQTVFRVRNSFNQQEAGVIDESSEPASSPGKQMPVVADSERKEGMEKQNTQRIPLQQHQSQPGAPRPGSAAGFHSYSSNWNTTATSTSRPSSAAGVRREARPFNEELSTSPSAKQCKFVPQSAARRFDAPPFGQETRPRERPGSAGSNMRAKLRYTHRQIRDELMQQYEKEKEEKERQNHAKAAAGSNVVEQAHQTPGNPYAPISGARANANLNPNPSTTGSSTPHATRPRPQSAFGNRNFIRENREIGTILKNARRRIQGEMEDEENVESHFFVNDELQRRWFGTGSGGAGGVDQDYDHVVGAAAAAAGPSAATVKAQHVASKPSFVAPPATTSRPQGNKNVKVQLTTEQIHADFEAQFAKSTFVEGEHSLSPEKESRAVRNHGADFGRELIEMTSVDDKEEFSPQDKSVVEQEDRAWAAGLLQKFYREQHQ
ncbi:unnamed protein product [Amoebophrya sp. A120]|nr:unnamed protein product [Amoebophrya sp. A120]|eukprot:GSA120T00011855001.1